MKLLVTGGAGFIGSNFIRYVLHEHPGWQVTNLDRLTYAGNLQNLNGLKDSLNYQFIKGDIANSELVEDLLGSGFDAIVNFAAESHVDRSILDSYPFLWTNVVGTQVLLEGAKNFQVSRFLQVSTDEVYGSVTGGRCDENHVLSPTSPYAASKASADLLCLAYWKTYHTPVLISRCTNNFGPYQYPEKLIPLVITNALENKPVPVYGDGLNVRDWIYVTDHCRAIDVILQKGRPGEVYNVGANSEKTNLEIIFRILEVLNKPSDLIHFVTDRAGHDRRYAVDSTRLTAELGWEPACSFDESLLNTIVWYLRNEAWWSRIKGGEYARYYERMYIYR